MRDDAAAEGEEEGEETEAEGAEEEAAELSRMSSTPRATKSSIVCSTFSSKSGAGPVDASQRREMERKEYEDVSAPINRELRPQRKQKALLTYER